MLALPIAIQKWLLEPGLTLLAFVAIQNLFLSIHRSRSVHTTSCLVEEGHLAKLLLHIQVTALPSLCMQLLLKQLSCSAALLHAVLPMLRPVKGPAYFHNG